MTVIAEIGLLSFRTVTRNFKDVVSPLLELVHEQLVSVLRRWLDVLYCRLSPRICGFISILC